MEFGMPLRFAGLSLILSSCPVDIKAIAQKKKNINVGLHSEI